MNSVCQKLLEVQEIWRACKGDKRTTNSTNQILRFFGFFGQNFAVRGAEHHKRATLTHNPAQLPSQSFSDSVHCVTNVTVYCLTSTLSWVSTTITHLTCTVSDLHPLLPDLSSHFLQIPGISFTSTQSDLFLKLKTIRHRDLSMYNNWFRHNLYLLFVAFFSNITSISIGFVLFKFSRHGTCAHICTRRKKL